jgi:uncharacterized membrane protein YczE
MNKSEQIKRYLFFVLGLMVLAFGVALSVKANLGTSPISSLPYVLSLAFPLTIGQFTILMHIVFILLQIALLRKDFDWIQLMQLPAAILFGVFTDAAMRLLSWYAPSSYAEQWICVLLSCVIVAVGVSMEVIANVVMLAGEGYGQCDCSGQRKRIRKNQDCFDSSLVLIAAGCSLRACITLPAYGKEPWRLHLRSDDVQTLHQKNAAFREENSSCGTFTEIIAFFKVPCYHIGKARQ